MSIMRRSTPLALLGLALAGIITPADAQYFGRNKVQYENFSFEVLKTEHFDIYYYPEEGTAVELAALIAERWYARLSRILNHNLTGRQPLILYASGPHFRQTNVLQGDIGEATGGVTEILKRRIVLPFSGPLAETDHVLGHELVHAFQFDMTGEGGGVAIEGIPAVMRLPLWFVEGMAEYLSVGPVDPNTAMWMRDAVRTDLPTVEKLSDPRYFPYRYGHALWSYIAGRWGDDVVGRILKATRTSSGNLRFAFRRVLRVPLDTVVVEWHQATRDYYLPLKDRTTPLKEYGRPLIGPKTGGGHVNLAPALSPDGRRLVFLSERDLFSVDMYLADAQTGQIDRRIVQTAINPHFESIQFINSAGGWDFEGRQFVFAGLHKGRPILSVLDVERNRTVREVELPGIGEVYNPSWSPDGRSIVFSGLTGGLSDLYLYDLEADQLTRLTNDAYADLQPAWSPDGRRVAFVTDRFTTGLTSLLYGPYRLALLDPATGRISEVPSLPRGKHINPQWSPDGASVYFISDRNGIPNVYRVELASGALFQVTNVFTGVSGITSLSPALSVAVQSGQLAMTVFEGDDHIIYTVDSVAALAGGPLAADFERDPAVLPPGDRLSNDLAALLGNAFFGLPRDTAYPSEPYSAGLALDYIGQPTLAVGADRFGTYIGGGASFFWSDVLGDHNLATALQVNGSFRDIAALVGYANRTRRLNWGVAVQQVPFRTGLISRGLVRDPRDNSVYFLEDLLLFRQINRQAGGVVAYPFSRVQRAEVMAQYQGVFFDLERRSRLYAPNGQLVQDTTFDLPTPRSLHLAQSGAALVYDNSLFGATSPILGQRYRFELGTTFGSLDYRTVLTDYRKYVMPVRPFTVAARLLHFGRYGRDEDSFDVSPLYLGFEGLVRGYEFGRLDVFEECPAPRTNPDGTFDLACPVIEQLYGSKIAVANLELRFPVLGVLGLGSGLFGFLPLEVVAFGDAGLAWHGRDLAPEEHQFGTPADERPFFLGGDRKPVFSAGTGLRLNVFGIAIISLYYVKPFNRPLQGAHVQVAFTPGF